MAYVQNSGQSNISNWQMSNPFQEHCKILWDREAVLYENLNNNSDIRSRINALDDWYDVLKTMRRRIISFIGDTKHDNRARRMKRIISDIKDYTKKKTVEPTEISEYHLCLGDCALSEKELIEIKEYLEEFSELIFQIMGDNNMLMPKKPAKIPGISWM